MKTIIVAFLLAVVAAPALSAADAPAGWKREWPNTDFTRIGVDVSEIDGNLPRDVIPSIDDPRFIKVSDVQLESGPTSSDSRAYARRMRAGDISLSLRDPVISLVIDGEARAYPLRIMMYHEIVNDDIGGRPVVVTFCPLCNAAVAFDRRIDGKTLDFGVTGKLRHSDLIMYDRQTYTWWQQFTGLGIIGAGQGRRLERLPARLESYRTFAARHPNGMVLMPDETSTAPYGRNPYFRYDTASRPFLYRGGLPEGIKPLARVVAVDGTAYSLELLRSRGVIEENGYRISWRPGQASALDAHRVAEGRDVGDVVVQKLAPSGEYVDAPYDVTFAFAFHAFNPDGIWRK